MSRKNSRNTPYYLCFAAGIYMAYIVYRMFTALDGSAETRHWILGLLLGLLALVMIVFGGYHVFFRRPDSEQEDANPNQEKKE